MKTLKIAMITFGILAMVSCKDSGKENLENDQYAADTPELNMDNSSDNVIDSEGVVIIDDQFMAFNTSNMKDMYESLDMTQDQINRFETDFNKKMQDMEDDSTMSLDNDKLQKEKDQSLKTVLSVEQYTKYDQWKKDHLNDVE